MLRHALLCASLLCASPVAAVCVGGALPRRSLLHTAATATLATAASTALTIGSALPSAAASKEKGYLTLSEYNALKAAEKKDEKLYGLFESLRARAAQTGEFDALAAKDDFAGVSNLARGWETSIRKELLETANKELQGEDKKKGDALNKLVLNDLKGLDKLAGKGSKGEIESASAALKGHVLEFVALAPKRLVEKFGVQDIGDL